MSRLSKEELVDGFIGEVQGYLPIIRGDLQHLLTDPGDRNRIRQVFRLFHNIKGAASQLALSRVSGAARLVEDMLEEILSTGRSADISEILFIEGTAVAIGDHCSSGELQNEQAADGLLRDTLRTYHELTGRGLDSGESVMQGDFEELCNGRSIVSKPTSHDLATLVEQGFAVARRIGQAVAGKTTSAESSADLLRQLKRLVLAAEAQAEDHGEDVPSSFTDSFVSFIDWLVDHIGIIGEQAAELLGDYLRYFHILLMGGGLIDAAQTERVVDSMTQVQRIAAMITPETDEDGLDSLIEDPDFIDLDEPADLLAELPEVPDETSLLFAELPEGPDETSLLTDQGDSEESAEQPAVPVWREPSPERSVDEDDSDLKEIFRAESEEHLQTIAQNLVVLEKLVEKPHPVDGSVAKHLSEMRRAIHTLKGAAGMTGFEDLSRFAHRCEDLLDSFFEPGQQIRPQDIGVLSEAADFMEMMAVHPNQVDASAVENLSALIGALLADQRGAEGEQPIVDTSDDGIFPDQARLDEPVVATKQAAWEDLPVESEDGSQDDHQPSRTVGVDDADQPAGPVEAEQTQQSDSAYIRVRLDRLDELVGLESELIVARSAMERRLADLSQTVGELQFATEKLKSVSQELESGFEVESLYGFGQGVQAAGGGSGSLPVEFTEFDPIELDRYSKLHLIIRSLNELAVDVASIQFGMADLANEMRGHVANQQLLMRVMQDKLMQVRMTPLSSVSRSFYRTVRSAANLLKKRVRLVIEGEDVYLDRYVWNKVADPIAHLLRNAVDHGIEDETMRSAGGKPVSGTIRMKAQQRGSHVMLEIADDGCGIDVESIRKSLVRRGKAEAAQLMGKAELLEQLFIPGVTTREEVSRLSGRGVGLDVVRQNLNELRGAVRIQTATGLGTSFHLRIPISLSINRAAIIMIGGQRYAVPLQDILEIRKIPADDYTDGDEPQVKVGEKSMPLKDVATLFGYRDGLPNEQTGMSDLTVLSVEGEAGSVALAIDRVVEQQEIIVKDLGSHLRNVMGISGVTIMGDGTLVPILNVSELAGQSSIDLKFQENLARPEESGPFTVMIVDDSVSVRQSVSRLIKNNGWLPVLATDGVDAAEKIDQHEPNVIILDIEMPRMNGFEFLGMVRSQARYRTLPIIMLTSRYSEKHQQKAMELGANHYVIKPYKEDQFVGLLQRIANETQ